MNAIIHGCTGKVPFATFGAARRAAKSLNRHDDNAHVHPYHCRACHGFHVGQDDTGDRRRSGRVRLVVARQAVTLAQFKALFSAAAADDQPEGEDHVPTQIE